MGIIPAMRRTITVAALIIIMAFQSMTATAFASSHSNQADLSHSMLHWQQEAHHHHEAGGYHVDDSEESTRHLMTDHFTATAVLPAVPVLFFRSDTGAPDALLSHASPHPFLEGPLRPPRLNP